MRRSQRGHSIDCSNSPENESDREQTPISLTRSRRLSRHRTPTLSDEGSLNESPEDSYLVTRTSEQSICEEDIPQMVTSGIPFSYRNFLRWLINFICFTSILKNTVCKAQLCPNYIGWTQTGATILKNLLHKLVEKLTILLFCVFAFWFIIIFLPTKLDTGRMSMRTPGEVKSSISSLKELRFYQEKVRKHAEEIQALYSLMKQLSAKVQEMKIMSNEDLVAQNIMKKIQGDYIEKPDFALKSIGGTIDFEHTSATYSCDKARSYWSWFRLWNYAHPPDVILEPNMTPGNCWAFSGDSGQVVIRLARKIFLTNITIQHIPKTISLSGNLDTAPKDFVVYGINDKSREETFLGAFLFQPENSIQMFPLKNTLSKPFNCMKLKILTNWGNPHFTCIYRVRAHGTMNQPVTAPADSIKLAEPLHNQSQGVKGQGGRRSACAYSFATDTKANKFLTIDAGDKKICQEFADQEIET
ncbi:SUN domain-containing protein 5 [Dromiciops gliroides]|uniref:SUN domain-containing protein 5 n=1 Tax=Dromiciops gliroides TaxID=33562 RepID=UPI001CC798F4|nr:SUN domain-containing protein 5 [Dromiciops gliroides]